MWHSGYSLYSAYLLNYICTIQYIYCMVSTTGKHSGHGNQHPCLNSAQWLVTVVPSTQVFKSSTVVSPNNTGILKLHLLKVPSANGTCLWAKLTVYSAHVNPWMVTHTCASRICSTHWSWGNCMYKLIKYKPKLFTYKWALRKYPK